MLQCISFCCKIVVCVASLLFAFRRLFLKNEQQAKWRFELRQQPEGKPAFLPTLTQENLKADSSFAFLFFLLFLDVSILRGKRLLVPNPV